MRVMGMCGSLRQGSYNRAVLQAAMELAPAGMEVRIWDRLGEVPHYDGGLDADGVRPEAVEDLKRTLAEADGLLIVSPEYNYSVPGGLKNAIDWASRPAGKSPFAGKPAAVAGASTGAIGTARGQAHLREVLYACHARVMPHAGLLVGAAAQKITDGRLQDEQTRAFLAGFLEHFAAWIRVAGTRG